MEPQHHALIREKLTRLAAESDRPPVRPAGHPHALPCLSAANQGRESLRHGSAASSHPLTSLRLPRRPFPTSNVGPTSRMARAGGGGGRAQTRSHARCHEAPAPGLDAAGLGCMGPYVAREVRFLLSTNLQFSSAKFGRLQRPAWWPTFLDSHPEMSNIELRMSNDERQAQPVPVSFEIHHS